MTAQPDADLALDASPTKEFFISMLTKDVHLTSAIADLVDNSLDGARRLRGRREYDGLWVHLRLSGTSFEIRDNCGGIDVQTARDYAFRFGRPEGFRDVKHSVGQFGVGMKRALFKMGKKFKVESATQDSRFSVTVDVDAWKAKTDPNWTFEFDLLPETGLRNKSSEIGTTVSVLTLHDEIARGFATTSFVDELRNDLALRHSRNLARGLEIKVNDLPLKASPSELYESKELKPFHETLRLKGKANDDSEAEVKVDIYAGVAKRDPHRAGWYVFCNDRLVLGPDRSEVTGWGESEWASGEELSLKVPGFHNQFNLFRGYVFLDADDASALPWNTTKTGVDLDHPVYRRVRLAMAQAMRPVIDFCNKVKDEKKEREDLRRVGPGPLERAIDEARPKPIEKIRPSAFAYPKPGRRGTRPDEVNVLFKYPTADAERVKKAIKARSYSDAGKKTFDYYFKNVVRDE